jgi:hypothetical protein
MKIKSLAETTTSGSVASVSSPIGGMHKRAGSMFKGKKTSKPFYEEKKDCGCSKECKCHENVTENKVKQLEMDLKEMNDKQFFDKYKKTKNQVRNGLKGGSMVHDNGQVKVNESKILKGMLEADLHEDDLILMPGQGARFKRELMPKKTDHEVEMARGQLYQSAKNAKDICNMLKDISEMEGIDAWVQSKITTAADYLETVRAYMESKYEMHHEVEEATAHEKFKKDVKKRGYDMDAGASRLERLLAKQAKERREFEKKYASAYGTKEVDEDLSDVWDTVKTGAGKAWDTVTDKLSNIGYGSAEEYGKSLAAANAGMSPKEYSEKYAKQLATRPEWQKELSNRNKLEKDQSGYKPYPTDARPVREEELNEIGWSSAADYGKDLAAANKYVPPAPKQAAPAGPSLWDRAKNVAASLRPFDEKTAASNFGYKPQQVAQTRTAPQTPMYEEDLYELSKDTLKSYVPKSVAKAKGMTRSNFDKAKKMADTDIPRAMKKLKDPNYGKESVNEGSLDDNAIWNQYGHYNTQDLMQEFPNLSPKDAESIVGNAERGWADPTYKQKYRDNVVKLVKMAMGQQDVAEEVQGLWANIHAKQNRIKHGSGERMRKPGSKGAPTKDAFIQSAKKK